VFRLRARPKHVLIFNPASICGRRTAHHHRPNTRFGPRDSTLPPRFSFDRHNGREDRPRRFISSFPVRWRYWCCWFGHCELLGRHGQAGPDYGTDLPNSGGIGCPLCLEIQLRPYICESATLVRTSKAEPRQGEAVRRVLVTLFEAPPAPPHGVSCFSSHPAAWGTFQSAAGTACVHCSICAAFLRFRQHSMPLP